MKEFIKDNYTYILVVIFCLVELINGIILTWELATGKSIVDKLWEVGSWMKSRMKK